MLFSFGECKAKVNLKWWHWRSKKLLHLGCLFKLKVGSFDLKIIHCTVGVMFPHNLGETWILVQFWLWIYSNIFSICAPLRLQLTSSPEIQTSCLCCIAGFRQTYQSFIREAQLKAKERENCLSLTGCLLKH